MLRFLFASVVAAVVLLPASAGAEFEPVRNNPADALRDLPPDPEVSDRAVRCVRRPTAGALALRRWLQQNAAGDAWGIVRCSRLSRDPDRWSNHAEGRALDWRLDAARPAERRAADRLIALLLAPDRAGTPRALARRMGIQEIIFNCRAWWAGSDRLAPYELCYDGRGRRRRVDRTNAHRDHVHIGLNRAGARMRTSFWRNAPLR